MYISNTLIINVPHEAEALEMRLPEFGGGVLSDDQAGHTHTYKWGIKTYSTHNFIFQGKSASYVSKKVSIIL